MKTHIQEHRVMTEAEVGVMQAKNAKDCRLSPEALSHCGRGKEEFYPEFQRENGPADALILDT